MAFSDFGGGNGSVSGSTVIVDELVDGSTGYAKGPERALMSALLFDGVQAYMSYACSRSPENRSRHEEAFNWVNRRDREYVFSFENVCESLGLEPEYVRLGLVNACNAQIDSWRRARRNF